MRLQFTSEETVAANQGLTQNAEVIDAITLQSRKIFCLTLTKEKYDETAQVL